jgi:hypothetical protein
MGTVMVIEAAVGKVLGLASGVFQWAFGRYFRRRHERAALKRLERDCPSLFLELREDLRSEHGRLARRVVLKPSKGSVFTSFDREPILEYSEDVHTSLRTMFNRLRDKEWVEHEMTTNVPIYRLKDSFVDLLLSTPPPK